MEETQQFCLKWNNYQSSLSSTFKDLLAKEKFVDCTLSCGASGHTINAHRVVLSACSPYFGAVLGGLGTWQHPVIILKDIKHEDLAGIIEFIYHGEVSIDQDCLAGFLQAAESLKIKGLTEDTTKSVSENSSINLHGSRIQERTHQINKALEKLVNSKDVNHSDDITQGDNNNDQLTTNGLINAGADGEEEEEALSELEIRENLKNVDFQAMYQTFMSGSLSEDSEGGKDGTPPLNEDGTVGFNLGDASNSLGGGKKTCPYCYQQLSWHALSRHIRDMHRAKADLVTCQYCSKTFRNKNSLGCHIWRFHKRGKELIGKTQAFDH